MTKVTSIINLLKKIDDIELFQRSTGGHAAQSWRIRSSGAEGSIPLASYGDHNFKAAIKALKKALNDAKIDSSLL